MARGYGQIGRLILTRIVQVSPGIFNAEFSGYDFNISLTLVEGEQALYSVSGNASRSHEITSEILRSLKQRVMNVIRGRHLEEINRAFAVPEGNFQVGNLETRTEAMLRFNVGTEQPGTVLQRKRRNTMPRQRDKQPQVPQRTQLDEALDLVRRLSMQELVLLNRAVVETYEYIARYHDSGLKGQFVRTEGVKIKDDFSFDSHTEPLRGRFGNIIKKGASCAHVEFEGAGVWAVPYQMLEKI